MERPTWVCAFKQGPVESNSLFMTNDEGKTMGFEDEIIIDEDTEAAVDDSSNYVPDRAEIKKQQVEIRRQVEEHLAEKEWRRRYGDPYEGLI